jgi:hypothetical protein
LDKIKAVGKVIHVYAPSVRLRKPGCTGLSARDTEGFQSSVLGQSSLNYEPTAGRFKPVILPQSIPIAPTANAIKHADRPAIGAISRHNIARRAWAYQ